MDFTSERYEKQHLGEVLGFVRRQTAIEEERKRVLDAEIDEMLEHYNSDNQDLHIALVVATDQQRELEGLLARFARAANSPFFGRVDFRAEGEQNPERIYIGRQGVFDEATQQTLVVDWRTPVANLYYDATPGHASYQSVDGEITGEMTVKRTYSIEKGEMTAFFDADTVANDVLLQEYLSKSADAVLRDIVATIQKDQNDIIRIAPWYDVIVQGVAGSGKTTVAMHRLAYLIFNHADTIKSGQFVIIGTNRMFLNYVSGMLPDLGVESVRQMILPELLGYVLHMTPQMTPIGQAVRAFKTSHGFFERLQSFIDDFEDSVFIDDVKILDEVVMTADEIREKVIGQRRHSMENRAEQMKSILSIRVDRALRRVLAGLQADCDRDVDRFRDGFPTGFDSVAAIIDHKYAQEALAKKQAKDCLTLYARRVKREDEHKLYRKFLRMLSKDELPAAAACAKATTKTLKANLHDLCDMASLLFIAARLYAPERADQFRHLVIDEAQDFGPMVYDCLTRAFSGATFTILGDVSQNIAGDAGIDDWDEVLTTAFAGRKSRFCVLAKSYRNTIEIADVANTVLSHAPGRRYGIEPVVRRGDPVAFDALPDYDAMLAVLREELDSLHARGRGSLAFICSTPDRARALHEALGQEIPLFVSDAEEELLYEGGASIFDAASVKGLEFDRVIIAGADETDYPVNRDGVRALYVACTRALHSLRVLYTGERSALFL
ncbi:MAG: hypothetical protein E7463_00005 [Ruminococcaceae bacterium]|nr:hypothetical protein [Oscillospiraceae bacterium]